MVITPHMIIGAAIGAWSPNYWLAFVFTTVSHFLADALPHRDYLKRVDIKRSDHLLKISIDFALGLICLFLLASFVPASQRWLMIFASLAALIPDCLETAYKNFDIKLLKPLSDFHHWIHREKRYTFVKTLPILVILMIVAVLFILIR